MSENPSTSDWAGARGEKWRAQLAGMEATLRPVDAPLIDALRLDQPCTIAEVGCGGGGTTIEILRRAPVGSTVHGFDIAPALIEAARGRALPERRVAVFDIADVASAVPPTGFDRLASRFGVMFFDDARAAFANLARWLLPGGRFAFAVWGPVSDNTWMTCVRDVVAPLVALPPPEPDAPGPFRYADERAFASLLDEAGFSAVDVSDWRGALPIGGERTPAQAADFALAAFSSFGELLAAAGPDALDEARRGLTAAYGRHHRDGAVWLDARVHIVTGTRR